MSLAYHSTEYLENQIETFKILLGKKDAEIASLCSLLGYTTDTHEYRKLRAENASLRAQNELTHAAYVEENNRLMAARESLRAELATSALACRPQPARNRPLPETRCDCCDNGLDDAWEFCPFCGQQHPDAAGALACRPQGEKS